MFNNPFDKTGVYYFPTPHDVFTSPIWSKLKPSAHGLYPFLLMKLWEQDAGQTSITLSAEDIGAGTGISVNAVKTAREDLVDKKLIHAVPVSKAGFEYSILNPLTGKPLEKVEDFDKLEPGLVQAYFMHHLAAFDPIPTEDGDGAKCRCPFHNGDKERARPLMVNWSNGWWRCVHKRHSGGKGKLVAFEMAMAETYDRSITPSQAHANIRRIVLKARRGQEKEQARQVAEAQSELIGPAAFESYKLKYGDDGTLGSQNL